MGCAAVPPACSSTWCADREHELDVATQTPISTVRTSTDTISVHEDARANLRNVLVGVPLHVAVASESPTSNELQSVFRTLDASDESLSCVSKVAKHSSRSTALTQGQEKCDQPLASIPDQHFASSKVPCPYDSATKQLVTPMSKKDLERLRGALLSLTTQYPDAAEAELLRFARGWKGDARKAIRMYQNYLDWRKGEGAPSVLQEALLEVPPNYIRNIGISTDGFLQLFVEGARYDTAAATPKRYAQAYAAIVDQLVGSEDDEKIVALVDVRGGHGWPNLPPTKMLPLFKALMTMLPDNFPERLYRIVVYPLPSALKSFCWMVSTFVLDTDTNKKLTLIYESPSSPWLVELRKYVSLDAFPLDARSRYNGLDDAAPLTK